MDTEEGEIERGCPNDAGTAVGDDEGPERCGTGHKRMGEPVTDPPNPTPATVSCATGALRVALSISAFAYRCQIGFSRGVHERRIAAAAGVLDALV